MMTDDEYAAIETKYAGKRLKRIDVSAGTIVLRQPTRPEHGAFKKMYFDPNVVSSTAYENLLVMTAVSPDNETLTRWLDSYPGLPMNVKLVRALKALSGEADEDEGK